MKNHILGTLYGMAIGDAMGMPPELWSRKRCLEYYGKITDFLDGCPENIISYQYKAGQFTDDTSQALTILDSLIETDFIPNSQNIATHILEWAEKEHAFKNNILGPTSKVALKLFQEGKSAKEFSDESVSNGAAMRIAPIGTLFSTTQKEELCRYVAAVSSVTHTSDITLAGASMIAMAVASALEYHDREKMIEDALSVEEYAMNLGASTPSPSLGARTKLGILLAQTYANDETAFLENIYNVIGAGVNTSESVPAALAIAYYSFDVRKCALLCANLGGDTDTIGAMAAAICGAPLMKYTFSGIILFLLLSQTNSKTCPNILCKNSTSGSRLLLLTSFRFSHCRRLLLFRKYHKLFSFLLTLLIRLWQRHPSHNIICIFILLKITSNIITEGCYFNISMFCCNQHLLFVIWQFTIIHKLIFFI